MALFLEFLAQQWMLVAGIAVCGALLMNHESRRGGTALSPQQLVTRINQGDALLVDLRDSAEFNKGHIVDAINIPHAKLKDQLQMLESHRDKPVILVCKMGQHCGASGKLLAAEGFTDINRLSGGITEWQNMQLPLVKS
jgi:rhodanese-related sulfurtransferase